jgi:hypothetical protein
VNRYSVACTGASQVAVPVNTGRKVLTLQNQDGARTFWVAFGRPATQDNYSVAIPPGLLYSYTAEACPTEEIRVNGPAGLVATIHEQ